MIEIMKKLGVLSNNAIIFKMIVSPCGTMILMQFLIIEFHFYNLNVFLKT